MASSIHDFAGLALIVWGEGGGVVVCPDLSPLSRHLISAEASLQGIAGQPYGWAGPTKLNVSKFSKR